MTSLYNRFAEVYTRGPYPGFAQRMAELLPGVLDKYQLPRSGSLLDIACGEGTFIKEMAAGGWRCTGVDLSAEMLRIGQKKLAQSGLTARLIQADMRSLNLESEYDLATCWFDSLNYLLTSEDLALTFAGVHASLKPGGGFIFDMNTIYGLSVDWQRFPAYVQQDHPDLLEVHIPSYDYENQIAVVRILFFIQQKDEVRGQDTWLRFEERHIERGYPTDQIKSLLEAAGFRVAAQLSSLQDYTPLYSSSRRVWFVACKDG